MNQIKSNQVYLVTHYILRPTMDKQGSRLPRKQDMERQHDKCILWQFQSSRTIVLRITYRYHALKIVQVNAPTTSPSDEETDNFYYNIIAKILEKQTHYTILMGDFNAKVGGQKDISERATG